MKYSLLIWLIIFCPLISFCQKIKINDKQYNSGTKCEAFNIHADGLIMNNIRYNQLYEAGIDKHIVKGKYIPKSISFIPFSHLETRLLPFRKIDYFKVTTNIPIIYNSNIYFSNKEKKTLSKSLTERDVIVLYDSLKNEITIAPKSINDSLITCSLSLHHYPDSLFFHFLFQNLTSDTLQFMELKYPIYLLNERHCILASIEDENLFQNKQILNNTIFPFHNYQYTISIPISEFSTINYREIYYAWFDYVSYKVNDSIIYYWKYFDTDLGEYIRIE
jgi:hypothetical protein